MESPSKARVAILIPIRRKVYANAVNAFPRATIQSAAAYLIKMRASQRESLPRSAPLLHTWELKFLERVILCYGTKPNMPKLRASNDSASHYGQRSPRGRRQRISVPILQTRLPNTRSRASERASREVNQLPGLAAGSLTEVGSMLRVSQPERDPMSSKFWLDKQLSIRPSAKERPGSIKLYVRCRPNIRRPT
jgi:hypothetical protein